MESMEAQKKRSIMARLRNRKGFSLIEMAIVLVIIGIIIGAIIKGQDLIANSNAKKAISAVSTWRNLTMTFLDRNGRFPGDENKNGIIGDDVTEQAADTTAIGELASVMEAVPDNPLVIGSSSFWVYIGNTAVTSPVIRNAIMVCGTEACDAAFTADQLEIIKAMDTAFDGSADGGLGQFRAVTAPGVLIPAAPALTTVKPRMSATFTAAVADDVTAEGVAKPWTTASLAAIWLFDKPF